MTKTLQILLPVTVVAVGAIGAGAMYLARQQPQTRVPEAAVPLVRVQPIRLEDRRLSVRSQGTVNPRTESTLVPEVAGRVVDVGASFVAGGFFDSGEVLLRVDAHDYERALVQARAAVAQAELRLARERAEAAVARREWEELGGGEATPLTLRIPQIADAEAALAAAQAAVDKAERDLERTVIRAPYAGRVRSKQVDLGQYVTPGTPLGRIYAVDYAEVRLPLPNDELAFLDLPLDYRGEHPPGSGPRVILRADFAGRLHEWQGRIVRTEGEIDPRSRMIHAVAQVRDPYARGSDSQRPPLAAGMFVEAEILGRSVERVAVVPRSALRGDGRVLVVDGDERLRFRVVEVLQLTDDQAIVRSGLDEGERLCVSTLAVVTDGMQVRVIGAEDASAARAEARR